MDSIKSISDLKELPSNSRICLYGTGGFCQNILYRLTLERPDISVPFLADTFKRGRIFGLDIIEPESLSGPYKDRYDYIFITTGQVARNTIVSFLKSLGINNIIAGDDKLMKFVFFKNATEGQSHYNAFNIEVSGKCNMDCIFCGYRERKTDHMEFGLFKQIIEQIHTNNLAGSVILGGGGEPALHPRILDILRFIKSKKLFVNMYTNGLILTPRRYKEISSTGVDLITVSIHNLSKKSFAYRKAGIDYTSYMRNITDSIDYHISNKLKSGLQIIFMIDPDAEGITSSDLWRLPEIKNDTANITELFKSFYDNLEEISHRHNSPILLQKDTVHPGITSSQHALIGNIKITFVDLDQNIKLKKEYTTKNKLLNKMEPAKNISLKKTEKGSCYFYLQTPQISYDGSLLPCCTDGILSELTLGKIGNGTTISDILHSAAYKKLIKGFMNNNIVMPTCKICMGKFEQDNLKE